MWTRSMANHHSLVHINEVQTFNTQITSQVLRCVRYKPPEVDDVAKYVTWLDYLGICSDAAREVEEWQ